MDAMRFVSSISRMGISTLTQSLLIKDTVTPVSSNLNTLYGNLHLRLNSLSTILVVSSSCLIFVIFSFSTCEPSDSDSDSSEESDVSESDDKADEINDDDKEDDDEPCWCLWPCLLWLCRCDCCFLDRLDFLAKFFSWIIFNFKMLFFSILTWGRSEGEHEGSLKKYVKNMFSRPSLVIQLKPSLMRSFDKRVDKLFELLLLVRLWWEDALASDFELDLFELDLWWWR